MSTSLQYNVPALLSRFHKLFCMRCLLAIVGLLFFFSPLRADDLNSRLRLLLPGDHPASVNERQFLHQRIRSLYATMDASNIRRKSTKKQIARIEAFLEKNYLRTYQPDARLGDALRLGNYNDATAALLTALVLEHYELDYYAVVDHWETYLVVDPDNRREVLRHPASQKHRPERETAFRSDLIQLLRATIAPDLEVHGKEQLQAAFSTSFYSADSQLSFGQLTAYALFQRASAAYHHEQYEVAKTLSEQATRRENRPVFLALHRAAEMQLAALQPVDEAETIATFYELWAENPENTYYPAVILNHFDDYQQVLLATDRPDLARNALDDYAAKAPAGSAAWEKQLLTLQRYRLLRHYYQKGRLDLAKAEAEALYAEDPENETIRYLLGELILGSLRRANVADEALAAAVASAAKRYPFIRQRDRFAHLLLRNTAHKVRRLFAEDQLTDATDALASFRDLLPGVPESKERNLWTLTAFYAAADYYFRQQQYTRSRELVDEALRYNPADNFLLHQRDLLQRY